LVDFIALNRTIDRPEKRNIIVDFSHMDDDVYKKGHASMLLLTLE
jgi:hypothetical protein